MDLLQKLYNILIEENVFHQSAEYKEESRFCSSNYEKLVKLIDKDGLDILQRLSDNYISLICMAKEEGFKQGFGTCVQLLIQGQ